VLRRAGGAQLLVVRGAANGKPGAEEPAAAAAASGGRWAAALCSHPVPCGTLLTQAARRSAGGPAGAARETGGERRSRPAPRATRLPLHNHSGSPKGMIKAATAEKGAVKRAPSGRAASHLCTHVVEIANRSEPATAAGREVGLSFMLLHADHAPMQIGPLAPGVDSCRPLPSSPSADI